MSKTLTARLDDKTQKELARLAKALGKSESEIVRESIRLMTLTLAAAPGSKARFIGVGKFASGRGDLATNKRHLEGFGK